VPEMPLFSLGAMTEGQLGSLIAIALYRACRGKYHVAAMLSHVIVDLADPAFLRPTKPIGPFFTQEQAALLAVEQGWDVAEDAGRGYRRVVASPEPKGFVEIDAIRCLLDAGQVVVAGGGGGIPVGRHGDDWDGVDAVIDKDYAAAELANQLNAEALVLVTGVEAVLLDFGRPTQRRVTRLTATEAERHLADGQFPEGSMGPKVRAATRFVDRGGRLSVITTAELAAATLDSTDPDDESVGTRIVGRAPRWPRRRTSRRCGPRGSIPASSTAPVRTTSSWWRGRPTTTQSREPSRPARWWSRPPACRPVRPTLRPPRGRCAMPSACNRRPTSR